MGRAAGLGSAKINAMDYTVKQLSKLAGVSVRTLHFYDEIGLLRPRRKGSNGYRHYGDAAALRLQQILFYKELGLSLDEIAEVLDQPDFDVVRALEAHRRALEQRLGRLRRLVKTVDRTIAHLKGEKHVETKDLFAGFSEEEQAQYEQEAEERWGESVRESSRKWKAYSPAKKAAIMAEGQAVYQELIEELDAAPASPAGLALIARWRRHLRNFYEPSVATLRGLGQGYNDDPQFSAFFHRLHPRLAAFMREAIELYCNALES